MKIDIAALAIVIDDHRFKPDLDSLKGQSDPGWRRMSLKALDAHILEPSHWDKMDKLWIAESYFNEIGQESELLADAYTYASDNDKAYEAMMYWTGRDLLAYYLIPMFDGEAISDALYMVRAAESCVMGA